MWLREAVASSIHVQFSISSQQCKTMAKTVRLDNNGQAIKYSPLGAVAPVTLFPTTVETVKDAPVLAIRTFYHFGAHVSLCDW